MRVEGVSGGKDPEWQRKNQVGELPPEGLAYGAHHICPYLVALMLPRQLLRGGTCLVPVTVAP